MLQRTNLPGGGPGRSRGGWWAVGLFFFLRSGLEFTSFPIPSSSHSMHGNLTELVCKFPASSLQVPCKFPASCLHLRCICIADLDLHMRCRRRRRNSWILYQVHMRCRFFGVHICVADKSDTRMHRRCRELAGNLQGTCRRQVLPTYVAHD